MEDNKEIANAIRELTSVLNKGIHKIEERLSAIEHQINMIE